MSTPPAPPAISEVHVQNALWWDMQGSYTLCPNYTPRRWYECDMFALTTAGYAVEYEIKLTAADFRKDVQKCEHKWNGGYGPDYATTRITKHERLAARDTGGPSRFWYITPAGLISLSDIPEWAGWKTFTVDTKAGYPRIRSYLKVEKNAPFLHRQKVPESVLTHMRSVFYYRYWKQRVRTPFEKLVDEAGGPAAEEPTAK